MKWALVLSGGGARGFSYIGMLRAFEELHFPKPDCIVGCSMGAVIGGLYASGMSVRFMYDFFSQTFRLEDYIEMPRFAMNKRIEKILKIGTIINHLISKPGADSGEKNLYFFRRLTAYQTFAACSIPFYCNASDLLTGEEVIIGDGFLADGMRASSSYPGFFEPFYRNGRLYTDGCVKHNTPVWIAKQKGFKNILAVTLGTFENKQKNDFDSSVSVIMRCMEIAGMQNGVDKNNVPTWFFDIGTNTSAYNFSDPLAEVNSGYDRTMANKAALQAFFNKGFKGIIARKKLGKATMELFKNETIF